ncbi:hypothetical protein IQ07DRAFT_678792 [Pyrenochaeta sp. DS3sAY3a]|nr:hypothetical protein IQ07DRAFT_678792 [Pyrenochaeta sp. DS3sAY3a]
MQTQSTEAGASKSLQCQHCDRHFTRPENLARHVKTHDAIRPHSCHTCGKQFSRSDLRRKHERLHERTTSSPQTKRRARTKSKPTTNLMTLDEPPDQLNDISLESILPGGGWGNENQVDPYFDYASFARPWNYAIDSATDSSGWLSSNFFAALRETDLSLSPTFLDPPQIDGSSVAGVGPLSNQHGEAFHVNTDLNDSSGHASRAQSPPNEASREDRLPFAWDPRSNAVVKARPIVLRPDDPIFAVADPKLAITQETLFLVQNFLSPREPDFQSEESFTIPSLPLINTFITLFFNEFSPQSPVLHRPTIDVNALPPPLLAIMIVIGSVYSHLRHTRRFGIIVLDRIRQNLHCAIEAENHLMREPLTIYTCALVCYMGLWCGNKRAFELAEALRAAVVTYTRRMPFESEESHRAGTGSALEHQWHEWIASESCKRLRWFVFMLDSQFFTILGMSGMMTLADVRKCECPCDDEFWDASTPRAWKNLMGSASKPSCPVYGPVVALFLNDQPQQLSASNRRRSFPRMNSWSANLVLTTIMADIFDFEQKLVVMRMVEEDPLGSEMSHQLITSARATELLHALDAWQKSYALPHVSNRSESTSDHFHHTSIILLHLGRINIYLPLSDMQDCIGRSGPEDCLEAMDRLRIWTVRHFDQACLVVKEAAACISTIMSYHEESNPYSLIGLFLSHIAIWAFANVATAEQRLDVFWVLQESSVVSSHVREFIKAGFAIAGSAADTESSCSLESKLIFKHAIQVLVQGSWGASSNLALLLHLQGESPHGSGQ